MSKFLKRVMDEFLMAHAVCHGTVPLREWLQATNQDFQALDDDALLEHESIVDTFIAAFPSFIAQHPEKLMVYQQASKYRLPYAALHYFNENLDTLDETIKATELYKELQRAANNYALLTRINHDKIAAMDEEYMNGQFDKCLNHIKKTIGFLESQPDLLPLKVLLEALYKYQQFPTCYRLNRVAKAIVRACDKYGIETSKCDFFEHSIMKMAGVSELSQQALFFVDPETACVRIQFGDEKPRSNDDFAKLMALFPADKTTSNNIKQPDSSLNWYEIKVEYEAFFHQFWPTYQRFIKQLAKEESAWMATYKTKSEPEVCYPFGMNGHFATKNGTDLTELKEQAQELQRQTDGESWWPCTIF